MSDINTDTPENLPERLMWFHETCQKYPGLLIWVPIVEAADEIKRLRLLVDELSSRHSKSGAVE